MVIFTATTFASCTSTSVLGLSRASYVDEEIQRLNGTDADVQQLRDELEDLQELTGLVEGLNLEIDGLEDDLVASQEADRKIFLMAEEFQNRLDSLPRETLLELKSAIEAYLTDTVDGAPPADG